MLDQCMRSTVHLDEEKYNSDPEYKKSMEPEIKADQERRRGLAQQFIELYPEHPQAGSMALTAILEPNPEPVEVVAAKCKGYMDAHPNTSGAKFVLNYYTSNLLRNPHTLADGDKLIADYIANGPPTMVAQNTVVFKRDNIDHATDVAPAQRIELLQALADANPKARGIQGVQGEIKRLSGLGKPFALSFEDAMTGKAIDMADYKGKIVIIDFWATWCAPCKASIPHLKEIYTKYHDKGVEVIAVSLDRPADKEKLIAYAKDHDLPWPQYFQGNFWKSEFSQSWGIDAIPALFVVCPDGNLYDVEARRKLDQLIPAMIAERDGAKK